ncbi:putative membrane protein [Cryobacterium sp. CAN_C3]|nr:putative membrane protein [Cryobacterium sp. CAN_C3]
MSTAHITSVRRRMWIIGIVCSLAILAFGLWVSVATGEWIALLCAGGLIVLPVGGVATRLHKSSR